MKKSILTPITVETIGNLELGSSKTDYTAGDLKQLSAAGTEIRPLAKELKKTYFKGTLFDSKWEPSDRDWSRVSSSIRSHRSFWSKTFSNLKGSPVSDEEIEFILDRGLAEARERTHAMLADDSTFEEILESNLRADGSYGLVDNSLVYHSPMGPTLYMASRKISNGDLAAIGLLTVSIIVEALGFIAALLGISLPKIDLVKLGNKLGGKTRSKTVFRQIDKLFKILQNKQKSAAEKLEAIVKFLSSLARGGIISDVLANMLASMSWWEKAGHIVMFLAQLALLLNPATGAALAAKKAIAIASGIFALAKKGVDFGRLLAKTA